MGPTDRLVESISFLQILVAIKIQSKSNLRASSLLSRCVCQDRGNKWQCQCQLLDVASNLSVAGNERKNVEAHQVSQAEAEELFYNQPLVVTADKRHSTQESRWQALGIADSGRMMHVTFALRQNETKIRIISARNMSRKERKIYEDQTS